MTIAQLLASADIDQIDAELLLAFTLKKDRTWLCAHSAESVDPEYRDAYQKYVNRRHNHEPIAYIVGYKEFYDREYTVNEHVLIPRPSTEILVEEAIKFVRNGEECQREADTDICIQTKKFGEIDNVHVIVDIGTGSGCIACALALELPSMQIIATDISSCALDVARSNAEKQNVLDRVEFRSGSLLEPVQDLSVPFIVVTNPPYIPDGESLMPDVKNYEPHSALFGGVEGNEIVDELLGQAKQHEHCRGVVIECRM